MTLRLRNCLGLLLAFVVMVTLGSAETYAEEKTVNDAEKPNIVLIMVDDFGAECVGCYGGESYKTPNIDALAASGMRFENAFSMPLCGPTRACILSGRYSFRSGVASNQGITGFSTPWGRGKTPEITFAHLLKQSGYQTAIAGKWALCQFSKSPNHVVDCGFDNYCMWPKIMTKRKIAKRYWTPTYYEDGKWHKDVKGVFGPDHYSDYLINFMKKNQEKPFLAYFPMALIHKTLEATPGKNNEQQGNVTKEKKGKGKSSHFAENVEYVDTLVGKIVREIDALKLKRKTVIIFTGDNGTTGGQTSKMNGKMVQGGKGDANDAGTRVPLIVRWAGVTQPKTVTEELVHFADILPTFAELAGAAVPKDRVIDGISFVKLLQGKKQEHHKYVFVQNGMKQTVRAKKWALMNGELYSLEDRYKPKLVTKDNAETTAIREGLKAELKRIAPTVGQKKKGKKKKESTGDLVTR